ncbi:hypothetical protein KIN20_030539 [Parelaphostrongylus tenuis]|uniref:Uncharacterized protein n=1 Tax=Parelaphostrongylus tenuis TaxID=148309 RepID=A0AAD5R4A6_PARTN|nr:hypothetical protein KIN20_030539 [Parelaphostrongylus tenuis]
MGWRAVYHALKKYPVTGKSGFVVGSQLPWVEVHALVLGARKLLTVDYQNTTIYGTNKLTYIRPIDFAKQWENENRSGYRDSGEPGRSYSAHNDPSYGDPIDPIGDLREMWKTLCLLKPGGIFYFGVPRGIDTVVFNIHRINGAIRLAMVMTGFEWLTTFSGDHPQPFNLTRSDLEHSADARVQDLYVLRKL